MSLNDEKERRSTAPLDGGVSSSFGSETAQTKDGYVSERKSTRFWLIIASLSITGVLAALEGTIISTTLPSISAAVGGREEFVWVAGAYFLAMTAVLPLFGQLANLFGRRPLLLISIALFVLGSGMSGGANNIDMLIGGRTVQGLGGGGINLLIELIVCDLVPLRERGQYTSILYSLGVVGSAMGPWIGGVLVDKASWRWVFYINLPIGGVALVIVALVLRVNHPKVPLKQALRRIDLIGNIWFLGATIALMFGLIYGGVRYSWSSWHIIVPLVLGAVGIIAFATFEASPYCVEPAIPRQVFGNRTSIAALLISLLHSSLLVWVTYFLSIYFEAVKGHSPSKTGVNMLSNVGGFIVAATIAGVMLTKLGRYRPWHFAGQIVMTIGMGLFSLLDESTPVYGWVLLIFFFAIGCGLVMPSLLPALQADLSDLDTASATAALTITRSFGSVLGALIPSIIFNNQFDRYAHHIQDDATRLKLVGGQAYNLAADRFLRLLQGETLDQVLWTYLKALTYVWYAGIAVCLAGLLFVFLEKEIDLRSALDTDFGLIQAEERQSVRQDPAKQQE